ncbi:MAG: large repetitive protein [Thermoleophilaceae bacterium]|nr:large repetitive protein [Thermoleophilaceae bacterium]
MRYRPMTFLAVGLAALGFATSASAVTYTVTNANESGAGSLADAITQANNSPGVFDTIRLEIAGAGVHTIVLSGAGLPSITDPVTIDATTQPGYAGQPLIEVSAGSGGVEKGFRVETSATTIKGFAITHFFGYGIAALSGASDDTFVANYVGVAPDGQHCAPNSTGILLGSGSGFTVGGTNADARNVISCNNLAGIEASTSATIKGNYIGLFADGTATGAQPDTFGAQRTGIDVDGAGVTIGGGGASGRNWIGGNAQDGVLIERGFSSGSPVPHDVTVSDAFIGTDPTGTAARPNGRDGIRASGSAFTITHNLISGNARDGVYLNGDTTGSSISGNTVGRALASDGTSIGIAGGATGYTGQALGNGRDGIEFDPGSAGTGTTGNSVSGNVIADNAVDGVSLDAPSGSGHDGPNNLDAAPNYFASNGGLAIDLARDGVTPNDPNDGDSGPNGLLNFPVLTTASTTGVSGTYDGAPGASVTISVFTSAHCDPTGYGEGETELTSVGPIPLPASGPSAGHTGFTVSTAVAPGSYVTALATDSAGNTSEFSQCLHLHGPPRASTGAASDVQMASATVAGTVSPDDGGTTHVTVEYGPTAAHEASASLPDLASDDNEHAVSKSLSGLQPGTTYHYEVVATNDDGTTRGGDRTFTTPPSNTQSTPNGVTDPAANGSPLGTSNQPQGGSNPGPTVGCKVPKLKGMTLASARKALTGAHCRVGKVHKVRRRHARHGIVLSTSPRPGTRLPSRSKVNLVVVR